MKDDDRIFITRQLFTAETYYFTQLKMIKISDEHVTHFQFCKVRSFYVIDRTN